MFGDEGKKRKKPSFHFKGIKKFDQKLTSAKLMQSDLMDDKGDQDYKDKVAKCFEMRSMKLKAK
jgi:hypothetical protein